MVAIIPFRSSDCRHFIRINSQQMHFKFHGFHAVAERLKPNELSQLKSLKFFTKICIYNGFYYTILFQCCEIEVKSELESQSSSFLVLNFKLTNMHNLNSKIPSFKLHFQYKCDQKYGIENPFFAAADWKFSSKNSRKMIKFLEKSMISHKIEQ